MIKEKKYQIDALIIKAREAGLKKVQKINGQI